MTQTTVDQTGAPRALSLPERLIGAVFSPTPTFESVVAHPRVLDVMAVNAVIIALALFAFLSTETGQQAFIDQQFQQTESWGRPITPQVEQQINAMAPIMRWAAPAMWFVIVPVISLVFAGVLHLVFAAMLGGGATFTQTLAVAAHAWTVHSVGGLGLMVLNFVRGTMSSATNLGVFVQMLPENSFIVRFMGMIDLVWVWYLIVFAIGLGVLFRRKTGSVALGLFGVYFVIALGFAVFRSALGGS